MIITGKNTLRDLRIWAESAEPYDEIVLDEAFYGLGWEGVADWLQVLLSPRGLCIGDTRALGDGMQALIVKPLIAPRRTPTSN